MKDNEGMVISLACELGLLDTVRVLSAGISEDFDWGVSYVAGFTSLGHAVNSGNIELVEYLVGLDDTSMVAYEDDESSAFYMLWPAPEKTGFTVLHFESLYGNLAVVEYMLQHCDAAVLDGAGATALHSAARGLVAKVGALEDDQGGKMKAANFGYKPDHAGVIKRLLRAGVDVNARDEEQKIALDHAKQQDLVEILKASGGQPGGSRGKK
ncbi:hypothetical protein HK101_006092 [Irineochytrium annulatum]|nr:hypothetical protein HK101_006092 [Irineochytrium annulatum]